MPAAKRAKEVVRDRGKVFAVGRILRLEHADEILADRAADMVAMTRAHIADPHLVRKQLDGREEELTNCAGINFCVERLVDNREVTCALNPVTGREARWGEGTLVPVPAGEEKRIAVVGGGPAGLKVAVLVAKRGHRVTVFEERDELGGNFNLIKRLPTRGGWQIAIDNLVRPLEPANVDVRMGTAAAKETLDSENWDAVVAATGSFWDRAGYSPYRPEREGIPGAEASYVLDVGTAIRRALESPAALGPRVLIVDETSGYLLIGLAELLANGGAESVEILTPHLMLSEDLVKSLDMPYVFPRLVASGVKLTAQHFVEAIEDGAVGVYDIWGGLRRTVSVDTVVLAQTKSPNEALWQSIRNNGCNEVHRVGDCVAPRKPAAVAYEAEQLGREI